MKKKLNNWMRLLSLLTAFALVLSLNLPVLASAVETGEPGTSESNDPYVDVPPVLEHTPITDVTPGEDVVFAATATDEIGIAYVQLFYRAANSQDWISVEMLPTEGDSFVFTLPAADISGAGMEYYIEVSDGVSTVRKGSQEQPLKFGHSIDLVISAVTPTKVDMSQIPNGITAYLTGSHFKEGMTLTVGGKVVTYTLISDSFLQFTVPDNTVGSADISITYQGATVTLENAISYEDRSSMLMLSYGVPADSDTQIRIPVSASSSNDLYSIAMVLKMSSANFSDISFVLHEMNSFADSACTVSANGDVSISVSAASPLLTGQPIGYVVATTKTVSGNSTASVRVASAIFNGANAGLLIGCEIDILDKTPPVITVAPYETAPTNKPITIYASVDEGTLNISSYTFTENGSIKLEAIDAAGNRSELTVIIDNIYKSYSLELLNVPEDLVIVKGMELDTSLWQLMIVYDSGVEPSVIPVTKDMVITTTNNVGLSQGLVVYEGRAVTFGYEILDDKDAQLVVTKMPDKVQYLPGEALDLTGLEVTLRCGESFTLVLKDTDYIVTGFDPAVYGTQMLTVTYGAFQTSFPVSVKSPVPDTVTSPVYTIADGYLSGIAVGTTLDALLENITEHEFVRVMNGEIEVSMDEDITTGMILQLIDGETIKQALTIVIRGDVNGDGLINITDMLSVKSHILGKSTLTGAEVLAADISGDGIINITDVLQLKAHILGMNTGASE